MNKWIVKYNIYDKKVVDIENKPFDRPLNSNGYWYHLDEGKTIENIIFYVDMDRINLNNNKTTTQYDVFEKVVNSIKNHIRNSKINKLNGANTLIFKEILKDKDNVSNIDDINIISYQFETTSNNNEGFSVYYSVIEILNDLNTVNRYTTFILYKQYSRYNNLNKLYGINTD